MRAVILMTRIPIPGKTKTRLLSILSETDCAEIHRCFLRDIFEEFKMVDKETTVFLSYSPEGDFSEVEDLVPAYMESFIQRGENLGERMLNAFKDVFKMGYDQVILLGSDIPEIESGDIDKSFRILEENDICIGPTLDGGYYLIGMREAHEFLFRENIAWGNNSVLESTYRSIISRDLSIGLTTKHRDIDNREDYIYLKEKLESRKVREEKVPENTFNFQRNREEITTYAQRQTT